MDKYAQALQAPVAGTPTSPLGDFPELRGMYDVRFQNAGKAGAMQALSSTRSIQEQNARAAEAAAKRAEIDKLQESIKQKQALADPNNYQKVAKEDGGFDYYDPSGNRISVADYAKIKNTTPAKVLADSENNLDRQYIQDHKNLNELLNTVSSGDQDKLKKIYESNPGLEQSIKGMKPDELVRRFRQSYPNIYGDNNVNSSQNVYANPTGNVRDISQNMFGGSGGQQDNQDWFSKLRGIFKSVTGY